MSNENDNCVHSSLVRETTLFDLKLLKYDKQNKKRFKGANHQV